jgi:hypothetical protein
MSEGLNPEHWRRLRTHWADRDVEALADALIACVRDAGDREAVEAYVRFAFTPDVERAATLATSPLERELLRNLAHVQQLQERPAAYGDYCAPVARQVATQSADALLDHNFPEDWTVAQWLNALALRETVPTRRVAVVVTMRDEGLSMLEFIAHHRALGVDSIFVYSNDNADGSEAMLEALAAAGVITYVENQVGPSREPQRKAYAHALHLLPELWRHEWVFFIDSDELFVPGASCDHHLDTLFQAVAAAHPTRLPSAVCFNWRWRTSDYRYHRDARLLQERFVYANSHNLSKSLVRLRDVLCMGQVHFPQIVPEGFLCDGALRVFPYAERWDERVPDYRFGALDHYWPKSFEEFSIKKAVSDDLAEHGWTRDFSQFFEWNAPEDVQHLQELPADWVRVVRAEVEALSALPGVADARAAVEANLPALLARFDSAGGLESVYVACMIRAHRERGGDLTDLFEPESPLARYMAVLEPAAVVRGFLGEFLRERVWDALDHLKVYAAARVPAAAAGFFNVALGKPATQSSVSEWSRANTLAGDAAGAVDGAVTGSYGFHTGIETGPWWCVDLQAVYPVREVRLYNRLDLPERADFVVVSASVDLVQWQVLFEHPEPTRFGGADGSPLQIPLLGRVEFRFLRVSVPGNLPLHLDEVEIYV